MWIVTRLSLVIAYSSNCAQPSNAANCATELLFQRFQHAPYYDAPHLNMTLRESVLRKVVSVFVAWAG